MLCPLHLLCVVKKEKHRQQLKKQQSEHEAVVRVSERRQAKSREQWRKKLLAGQEKLSADRARWQEKLDKLDAELEKASDRVYSEKVKRRRDVQQQLMQAANGEMKMQHYINSLDESNAELTAELKTALEEKRAAKKAKAKAKKVAADRLEKWHAERALRQAYEDELAEKERIQRDMEAVLAKYQAKIEASDDLKRRLKKEWKDEEAARRRGGAKRWPVWVVQLI